MSEYVQSRSSRHLPPAIEDALKKYTEAVEALALDSELGCSNEETAAVKDKKARAERKLRRAIAADLHPEAVTQLYSYKEGDEVVWMQARGNGGSYRTNPREYVQCKVLRDTGKQKVQVRALKPMFEGEDPKEAWVLRRCLLPKDVYLGQGMSR